MTPKIFNVSWDIFVRDTKALAWRLEQFKFDSIICVTRGGLIPAGIIATELNIRYIDTFSVVSYRENVQEEICCIKSANNNYSGYTNPVIIDELADSGNTFRYIKQFFPKAHYAAVYVKPQAQDIVDTFVTEVSQDTWIKLPWENE